MAPLLRRVESVVPRKAREYGGKARNLATLARAGFPVPAAWAMSGEVCQAFLRATLPAGDQLPALLGATPSDVTPDRLARIRERLLRAPLPEPLVVELTGCLDELRRAGALGVAVRSSSTREDAEASSAAGLHATVLNVRTREELLEAVRQCWASLYQPRVLAYLRTIAGAPDASMGVVVQALVPARVSGVLFTVNPLTGDTGEVMINASWGIGSAVADGRVSPDTFRLDKATGKLRDRVLGDKRIRVVVDVDGGVREEEVASEERRLACLDEPLLAELRRLGQRIEAAFESPQDVEFSVVGQTVYVLQTRPVSAIAPAIAKARGRRSDVDRSTIVWSNVNVGEALPGVATPLTWSVLSRFSELGFRRACGSLGCSVPRDAELVGSFRGRIYLNLSELMGVLSQVPVLKPTTLLSLGGGGEAARLEAEIEGRSRWGFYARLPMTVSRFVRENYRVSRKVEELEALFTDERERFRQMDLRVLSPAGLDKTLRDVEALLDRAGAVMLTCYGNLLLGVVALRAVLHVVAGESAEGLERGLITGLADVDSAAPGLSLWHIAQTARADGPAREMLLARPPRELAPSDLPEGPTRRAIERFLQAHGHRGAREAELSEPRWREDPSLLFSTLRAHLRAGAAREHPVDAERRLRAIRDHADRDLDGRLPPPARAAVRHLLSLVQRFMRLRERLRSHVTLILGMVRDVALDASRRLAQREPGVGTDAAFFLTIEELHCVLTGELSTVGTLVRQRRQQYQRDRALPDPPDTFVGFPPELPPPPPSTDSLRGLPASSGRVEGRARVLMSPSDGAELRAGEVLVAPYADVGWSPLFTLASAVVTDLGGPLSHASIVAREYAIPTVVNLKVGTRVIRTGDRVSVDGDTGEVLVLERAEADPQERSAEATAAQTEGAEGRGVDG